MSSRRLTLAGLLVITGLAAAAAWAARSPAATSDPALPPFEFHREGAATPEAAATALFRGCALGSPAHFVHHLLLGVCDGPIATLQKFAEALHKTRFRQGANDFTFHDLRDSNKGINPKKPLRVIATTPFDPQDKRVAALQLEAASTYSGKTFSSVDVAAEGYDGLEYHTRLVVAEVDGRWYALPRCRSSNSFYAIADALPPAPLPARNVK